MTTEAVPGESRLTRVGSRPGGRPGLPSSGAERGAPRTPRGPWYSRMKRWKVWRNPDHTPMRGRQVLGSSTSPGDHRDPFERAGENLTVGQIAHNRSARSRRSARAKGSAVPRHRGVGQASGYHVQDRWPRPFGAERKAGSAIGQIAHDRPTGIKCSAARRETRGRHLYGQEAPFSGLREPPEGHAAIWVHYGCPRLPGAPR